MKYAWKDTVSSVLVLLGAVVVFAKIQSYNWWMLGSWKSALGVIGVISLGIIITNIVELAAFDTVAHSSETTVWFIAATILIASLFAASTSKAEFLLSATGVAVAWGVQMLVHFLDGHHSDHQRLIPAR